MKIDVVNLPAELNGRDLSRSSVVVFDVLRATTTMLTGLTNGVSEIRVFASHELAKQAHANFAGPKLLAGETNCLMPDGFDLGNSPRQWTREAVAGKTAFLSTTNGTRAIHAALNAWTLLIGAIVNAAAVAEQLQSIGDDVVLLCAGTQGEFSGEDFCGAGAVVAAMSGAQATENARAAANHFLHHRGNLGGYFRTIPGGHNILAARLEGDIEVCAAMNSIAMVAECNRVQSGVCVRSRA
jgi:2-phosphosulfolactate phosphatase